MTHKGPIGEEDRAIVAHHLEEEEDATVTRREGHSHSNRLRVGPRNICGKWR